MLPVDFSTPQHRFPPTLIPSRRVPFPFSFHSSTADMSAFYPESDAAPEYAKGHHQGHVRHSDDTTTGDAAAPDAMLQALGYAPELVRNRSTFQVAFMSFVLASIPYGLATTLLYPLTGGGMTCVIWGWLAVSIIIMCVAASLGEITSVFPTAGVSRPVAWSCGPQ